MQDKNTNEYHNHSREFIPFTFQIGVDEHEVEMLLQRVADAQLRFLSSPLSQVANRLEQEVLVSSIFSTNTIEGARLLKKKRKTLSISTPRALA